MLNDKHDELTQLTGNIERMSSQMRETFEPLEASRMDAVSAPTIAKQPEPAIPIQPEVSPQIQTPDQELTPTDANHNLQILSLHKSGKSSVEIARELGLGTGEVKLVIDLFEEGK